jgi:hypothetical protein
MDPYERADITSDQYYDWIVKNAYLAGESQMKAAAFLETFVDYPPSQRPASFSIDRFASRWTSKLTSPSKNAAWSSPLS